MSNQDREGGTCIIYIEHTNDRKGEVYYIYQENNICMVDNGKKEVSNSYIRKRRVDACMQIAHRENVRQDDMKLRSPRTYKI